MDRTAGTGKKGEASSGASDRQSLAKGDPWSRRMNTKTYWCKVTSTEENTPAVIEGGDHYMEGNCDKVCSEVSCTHSTQSIVIKALCQVAGETVFDELYHAVDDLVTILENIFYHGLKRRGNFQFRGSAHPWDLVSHVCERVCPGCVEKVELISRCQSDHSKLRTWIKIALMEHRLHDVFSVLRAEIPKLEKLYNKEAILLSSELDEVVDAMYHLKSLEFSLNVKQNHRNTDGFKPIDYTPYLSGDACRFQHLGKSSEKHHSKEQMDRDSHWRLRFIEQQKICDLLRDQQ
ncbi:RUN domain-containing protein 3B, partial [Clonorchis sinensis]